MKKCISATLAIATASILTTALVCAAPEAPEKALGKLKPVEASKDLELPTGRDTSAQVQQGRYLVGLLGCASCHTDGALIGKPDPARTLAGSRIGIAYSNPMVNEFPGAVYPGNLTPHRETGIGNWSEEDIVDMLRSGRNRHGRQTLSIMPWTSYGQLSDDDALAIARYLKSLAPVEHRVPARVMPGQATRTPLVHVGLYRSP